MSILTALLQWATFVALCLLLAAAFGTLRRRHEPVRVERIVDLAGCGESCRYAVCQCGATKDMSGGRWSQLICRP